MAHSLLIEGVVSELYDAFFFESGQIISNVFSWLIFKAKSEKI